MKHRNICSAALAVIAAMGLSFNAHADWTFTASTTASTTDPGYFLANSSYAGPPTLTISGAYAANNTSVSPFTGFAAGSAWVAGDTLSQLNSYSGALGMASDGKVAPNHAIDNVDPKTEAVMLSFGSSVVLSSIGISYKGADADVSVFRWKGSTAPPVNMNGTSTSLTSATSGATAGWQLVGNYANMFTDSGLPANMINSCTNPSGVTVNCSSSLSMGSSWWLISAYNASYGTGTNLDEGNDSFKIYAVAGAVCASGTNAKDCGTTSAPPAAPEPASLALVAVGLAGAFGMRRRRAEPSGALAAA